MTDPIRAELEALITAYDEHGGKWPQHHEQALFDAVERARAALDAQPPAAAPAPTAARPAPTPDDFRRWWRETGAASPAPSPEMLLTANAWAEAWAALREPVPASAAVPVSVAERPWERPGWCDAEGRCWWFAPTEAIPGGFRCAGWSLYAADPADEDTHCLPHWALPIPQPPQGGEVAE